MPGAAYIVRNIVWIVSRSSSSSCGTKDVFFRSTASPYFTMGKRDMRRERLLRLIGRENERAAMRQRNRCDGDQPGNRHDRPAPHIRDLIQGERNDQNRDQIQYFNQRVQGRTRRIFIRITDGVSDDGGLVRIGAFAT